MAAMQYGPTAKRFHWLIVALLAIQYPIGWLMPDIHGGDKPGTAMMLHLSVGLTILVVMTLRLLWRVTHPVAQESSLPAWQRHSAEAVHWLLYLLVLTTTLTGWLFASFRGWAISYFGLLPFPMLAAGNPAYNRAIDGFHQAAEWALLIVILGHVAAALAHRVISRDRVMQRMLPE